MPPWVQIILTISAVTLNGGFLLGFFAWVRSKINEQTAQISALLTWRKEVNQRCRDHREDLKSIFNAIDATNKCVGEKMTEVAGKIGVLDGKLDILTQKTGK